MMTQSDKNTKLQSILNHSKIIAFIWNYDDTRTVSFVSEGIEELGYQVKDFLEGHITWREVIHPEDVHVIDEANHRIKSGKRTYTQLYRVKTKTGGIRWFEDRTFIVKDEHGTIKYIEGILTDITTQKTLENQLIASEELFTSIIDQVPMLVYWKRVSSDEQLSRYQGANKKFLEFVGATSEQDIIGKTDYDFSWSDQAEKIIKEDLKIIKSGKPLLNIRNYFKANNTYWKTNKLPYKDVTRHDWIIGISENITNRIEEKKQLKEQKDNIELFMSILTHDLKNLQHVSEGFIDLALFQTSSQPLTRSLKQAKASLLRSKNLLQNVAVTVKHALSDQYTLKSINILEYINRAKKTTLELYPTKNIGIDVFIDDIELTLKADALFEQLILNLLTNAVKYDPHDFIKIEISVEEVKRNDSVCVIISVLDHGKGIPPANRKNIFQRYNTFRETGSGSGLGLYIVKTLMNRYEGKITVKSRVSEDWSQGTIMELAFSC